MARALTLGIAAALVGVLAGGSVWAAGKKKPPAPEPKEAKSPLGEAYDTAVKKIIKEAQKKAQTPDGDAMDCGPFEERLTKLQDEVGKRRKDDPKVKAQFSKDEKRLARVCGKSPLDENGGK